MFVTVSAPNRDLVRLLMVDDEGVLVSSELVSRPDWPRRAAELEQEHPRWVWDDTQRWYLPLLAEGVRVQRCHDLRLCRTIVRNASGTRDSELARAPRDRWDGRGVSAPAADDALFELEAPPPDEDPLAEWERQRSAVAASPSSGRLTLLLAAESAGALVAAEMHHAGLPWDPVRHDEILTKLLGPQAPGERPARMQALVTEIRAALDDPGANPDSATALLKSLHRAGLRVSSTNRWELAEVKHPVVAPLIAYKKLSRLHTANGWAWLEEWVREGRFRPVYVPGGVVTGRWASDGGGALQLPKQVRGAVVADPGWKLVVADAAQLEPRVLAAMSQDHAMARAGRAHDLYQGMVAEGAVETREQAKYGMLGAIYGGTTGESGRMRPRIARAFPRAMAFVEDAARAGERGESVSTWLGRSSPRGQHAAYDETRSAGERERERLEGLSRGRFTRNFVVQGTAAEWALCWMGSVRRELWELGGGESDPRPLEERPHLVFFLHDELIVHVPAEQAEEVAEVMRRSAAEAGHILFGQAPVEFPLTVAIVDSYADAK